MTSRSEKVRRWKHRRPGCARSPAAGSSAARWSGRPASRLPSPARAMARRGPGPDRVDGAPIVLPENLWGWYDGRTAVTLPSGRVITPPARTYLKYNPDAFAGRVVTTPNGRIVADQFWYGDAAIMYDEFRTDNRFNLDMSIRRTFDLTSGVQLEFGADADEHPEPHAVQRRVLALSGGRLRPPNPALGLVPGMGNLEQLRDTGDGDVQPAADSAEDLTEVLKRDVGNALLESSGNDLMIMAELDPSKGQPHTPLEAARINKETLQKLGYTFRPT